VHIQTRQLQRRAARIVGKIAHHVFHRADLADDGLRGALQQLRVLFIELAAKFVLQALRRKLDRRERVLDFVREAARHLAPSRLPFRPQQVADVIEHDHITRIPALRQARAAHQQNLVAVLAQALYLALPFAVGRLAESLHDGVAERPQQAVLFGDLAQRHALHFLQRHGKDLRRTGIHRAQAQFIVQRQHAGRQVGQHAFQVAFGAFHFALLLFAGLFRLKQLLRHLVEQAGQRAQLVAALYRVLAGKIALRHSPRAFRKRLQRGAQPLADEKRRRYRRQQHHQ